MNTAEFLAAVLPDEGNYYVYHDAGRWTESVHASIEQALTAITTGIEKNANVYVGLSSFKDRGAGRNQNNAQYRKVFIADLDCGPEKEYKSKADAKDDLMRFLRESGFPPPSMIIDSGNGLHVYWVLTEYIDAFKWKKIADAAKKLFAAYDFYADAACTADSARILRVPGSMNVKDKNHPVECRVLKDFETRIEPAAFLEAVKEAVSVGFADSNVVSLQERFRDYTNDDLGGDDYQPRYFKHVVEHCPTMKHILDTNGADCGENIWKDTMNMLVFCEDGNDYVHEVSRGHDEYDYYQTRRKYQTQKTAMESGNLKGAPTCDQICASGGSECRSCPKWSDPLRNQPGGFTSPIRFGAKPSENDIPFPYSLATDGMVVRVKDDDGNIEIKKCFDYRITDVQHYHTTGQGDDILECTCEREGKQYNVQIPQKYFEDQKQLWTTFVVAGVTVRDHYKRDVRILLMSWLQQIQERDQSLVSPERLGWNIVKGQKAFAMPEALFTKEGEHAIKPIESNIYNTSGKEEKWREMVAGALKAQHIETEVILATAFASPLMEFTAVSGGVLSAVSARSGTGKTTALKLAQAVWGNPKTGVQQLSDTQNAIMAAVGRAGSLPSMWDEVRVNGERESYNLVNTIYQITQGREKNRLRQDASQNFGGTWKTMMVCASNKGIQDYVRNYDAQTDAGMYRVLEFNVAPLDEELACSQMMFAEIEEHCGHIGAQYARKLVEHQDQIKELMAKRFEQIHEKFGSKSEVRFITNLITALVVGASLAKKWGFVDFNVQGMYQFLMASGLETVEQAEMVRDNADGNLQVVGLLKNYLLFAADKGLVTDYLLRGKEKSTRANKNTLYSDIRAHRGGWEWQYAKADKLFAINAGALHKFANGRMQQKVLAGKLQEVGATSDKVRIGRGVLPQSSQMRAWVIPYNADTCELFDEEFTSPDEPGE